VRDLDGDEGPQAACEVPVSTLHPHQRLLRLTLRCLRVALYCVSLSRSIVSSNSNPEPPLPHTHPNSQSKACQKAHWKWIHKTACSIHAGVRQSYQESPKEKEASRKVARWIHAWTPTIAFCSPIALDPANHKWGRHETHGYVPYVAQVRVFWPNPGEQSRHVHGIHQRTSTLLIRSE